MHVIRRLRSSKTERMLHNVCDTSAASQRTCHDFSSTSMTGLLYPDHDFCGRYSEIQHVLDDTERKYRSPLLPTSFSGPLYWSSFTRYPLLPPPFSLLSPFARWMTFSARLLSPYALWMTSSPRILNVGARHLIPIHTMTKCK